MKDTSSHITVQFLTETYTTYRPLVFRYISYKLNGCLEAEDLVQDAFLRLLEYRSMLRPETIRSFLYTIVRNISLIIFVINIKSRKFCRPCKTKFLIQYVI